MYYFAGPSPLEKGVGTNVDSYLVCVLFPVR